MSGDQADKAFLTSEISAEESDYRKILNKSPSPTTITVKANGFIIQSNLNPNALEFFPSYMQHGSQFFANEKFVEFDEEIYDEPNPTDETNHNEGEEEVFTGDFEETPQSNSSKIEEFVEVVNSSQSVTPFSESEQTENTDSKLDLNFGKNQLYVLYATPSEVKTTSSEKTVRSIILEEKEAICRQSHSVEQNLNLRDTKIKNPIDGNKVVSKQTTLERSIKKVHKQEKCLQGNLNGNCNMNSEIKGKIKENIQKCNITVIQVKEEEKANNTKIKTIKRNNVLDKEINPSKDQSNAKDNISKEIKGVKKCSIITKPKITKPQMSTISAAGKTCATKPLKNEEPKKEIIPKAEVTLTQNSNLNKIVKNTTPVKASTNSRIPNSLPNKLSAPPLRKEITKTATKDTSNKTVDSTEKGSYPSTKSCPPNSKVKPTEKPVVGQQNKAKENPPKSPRPTVSSKLRKTETQKRRNLFYDLDTIKMSEFLFK